MFFWDTLYFVTSSVLHCFTEFVSDDSGPSASTNTSPNWRTTQRLVFPTQVPHTYLAANWPIRVSGSWSQLRVWTTRGECPHSGGLVAVLGHRHGVPSRRSGWARGFRPLLSHPQQVEVLWQRDSGETVFCTTLLTLLLHFIFFGGGNSVTE